jgi:hypothetical protein
MIKKLLKTFLGVYFAIWAIATMVILPIFVITGCISFETGVDTFIFTLTFSLVYVTIVAICFAAADKSLKKNN